jgi:hypothetical protein
VRTERTPTNLRNTAPKRLADDLLSGVRQIADYLGDSVRRTQYLVERDLLPTFRIGTRICARKSELNAVCRAPAKRPTV